MDDEAVGRCPIGMDDNRTYCSAGTYDACADDLRKVGLIRVEGFIIPLPAFSFISAEAAHRARAEAIEGAARVAEKAAYSAPRVENGMMHCRVSPDVDDAVRQIAAAIRALKGPTE